MKQYTTEIRGHEWQRVPRNVARRVLVEGMTAGDPYSARVIVCGCNMRPGGPWGIGSEWCSADLVEYRGNFNTMMAEAEYYECDNKRGRYLSYWVPVE